MRQKKRHRGSCLLVHAVLYFRKARSLDGVAANVVVGNNIVGCRWCVIVCRCVGNNVIVYGLLLATFSSDDFLTTMYSLLKVRLGGASLLGDHPRSKQISEIEAGIGGRRNNTSTQNGHDVFIPGLICHGVFIPGFCAHAV